MKGRCTGDRCNHYLKPGRGGPRALKYAAGVAEIQEECNEKGPIGPGEAVETDAYQLDAEHVIHAAIREPTGDVSESAIRDATTNTLKIADACGCESIAFPVLGKAPSSVDSPTLEQRASCMLEKILEFESINLTTVVVVSDRDGVLDEDAYHTDPVWDAASEVREEYDGPDAMNDYWEGKEWEDLMWKDSVLQFGLPVVIRSDEAVTTTTEVLLADGVMRIDDEITVQVGDTVEYKGDERTYRIKEELPRPGSGYTAYGVSPE
ncbi:macro domain-containing protein [Halobellus ruber]|uniref:Macro domain-containing protein n=1 Tax=Halobellus ruber TaxID=2761102 RepID=A0A7J9SKT4_9EURY|nr:macro domain-containing protein [Halobellus ruber]